MTAHPSNQAVESCLQFDCEGQRLLGVLTEPAPDSATPAGSTGVLVVVGGPQYRAGAHRQFTLLARQLAAAGYPVLRFDVRGMGDSPGAQRSFEALDADVHAAVQALLQARPGLRSVVLWGLCDGASAALLALQARPHPAVAGLCLLNPWVRSAASLAQAQVKHYYRQRLLQADFWRKLLRGGVALQAARDLLHNLRTARGARAAQPAGAAGGQAAASFQQRMAQGWLGFAGPVLLLLSEHDTTAQEFSEYTRSDALWQRALRQRPPQQVQLAAADHTCSSPQAQAAAEQATLAWLQRHFSPAGARSVSVPAA
jgi:exosortase A-associated hydrolase 1